MALPTQSIPGSAPYSTASSGFATSRGGLGQTILAPERTHAIRDALQAPQRPLPREAKDEQNRAAARNAQQGNPGPNPRGLVARPQPEAQERHRAVVPRQTTASQAPRAAASAPFLVQLIGQDAGKPRVFNAEHRDAASHGSDAYRRAGATPPIYSEQPTVFSVAI